MATDMKTPMNHSEEFEIDTSVEDLLGKLISGNLTDAEMALYNQLLAQRSRMMRPRFSTGFRRRAAA